MSMDKSLKRTGRLSRQRSVLTRAERITRLMVEERWPEAARPIGLPKVKVIRTLLKKVKKAAKEEVPAEGAAAAAAPGTEAAAPAGKAGAGKAAPAGKPAAATAKPATAAKPAAGKPGAKSGGKG